MPAVATDDFNRTDAVTLGANWTLPYSASPTIFRVVSNRCQDADGGTVGIFWNASSFNNDQYAKIKTIAFSNPFNEGFGAAVRCSGTAGSNNFCGYTFHSDGNDWKLSRQDSGVVTNLATGTQAVSANDIIEIRAVGTTITGYINGSAVSGASATDATYASGQAGMVLASSNVTNVICDDWEGGNVLVNVSVDLTGVAASPAIGDGTVTITSPVTPPDQGLVAGGGHWYGLPEDEKVYLTGVAANPQVGEVLALGDIQGVYEKYTAPIPRAKTQKQPEMPAGMRGLFKKVEKPIPPAVFVYQVGLPKLKSAVGTGKVTAHYEELDEETIMLIDLL